jgi:DNA primase|tara:strand:+ start:3865 stop:5118 length:1254 start_codon:yes stop_codon:yes gene_type:complete
MGKIAQTSSKYIIHAKINAEGVIDKPDAIGAIFGQTEGLLGADLELRELQRSGRIGRIEVSVETRNGKSEGSILIPSSLDKAETSIVAAALEIIERIGPCDSKVRVESIEDVRISKRTQVIERAKELLKELKTKVLPDSQEIANEVSASVRVMEIQEYGKDRLASGPAIDESDEIILVEGRADVVNLLKYGFKNAIAMNGTSVPETIIELSKKKTIVVFVDGDRGGNLILKSLFDCAEIDFITRAPPGKELEELTQKEIHKALRSRIAAEQAKLELTKELSTDRSSKSAYNSRSPRPAYNSRAPQRSAPARSFAPRKLVPNDTEKQTFSKMLEDLIGTRGAYILDPKLNILGKVPLTELGSTVKSLNSGIHSIILDGSVDKELAEVAEKAKVKFVVGMDSKVKPEEAKITILTSNDL